MGKLIRVNNYEIAIKSERLEVSFKWNALLTAWIFLTVFNKSFAQETFFSQHPATPLSVNPAFAGASDDAFVSLTHRTQQYAKDIRLNSSYLSGSYPLMQKKTGLRKGGLGLSAFNENNDAFKNQGFAGFLAYNILLSKSASLSFGMEGNYYQKNVSYEGFTTGSQWIDNYGFNSSVAIDEPLAELRTSNFLLGGGILWSNLSKKGKRAVIGFSLKNLNQPTESFTGGKYRLPIKYQLHGGYQLYKSRTFGITSDLLWVKGGNGNYVNIGSTWSCYFNRSNPLEAVKSGSVDFATRYVLNKALSFSIQLNQPNFAVGVSYDAGFSPRVESAPFQNALEFFIRINRRVGGAKKKAVTIDNYSIGEVRDFYEAEKQPQVVEKAVREFPEKETEEEDTTSGEAPVRFALKREFKFRFNDSEISDEGDKQFMQDLLKLMNGNKKLKMEIIGHADNVGTDETNQKVSEQRAQKVYEYLVSEGIDKRRLQASGKGAKEPLVPNNSEANRAVNRRVEFIIYK